jgi:Leucine-rich repeat (LRR) protein
MNEAIIRFLTQKIGHLPPFTRDEIGDVDRISLTRPPQRPQNLNDLQALLHVSSLDITETDILDISAVKMMPNLRHFYATKTAVSDITPLGSCKDLRAVDLFNSPVKEIDVLLTLPRLTSVNLFGTALSERAFFEVLPKLRALLWERVYSPGEDEAERERHFLNNFEVPGEEEWRLTLALQERGVPACYTTRVGNLRLREGGEVSCFGLRYLAWPDDDKSPPVRIEISTQALREMLASPDFTVEKLLYPPRKIARFGQTSLHPIERFEALFEDIERVSIEKSPDANSWPIRWLSLSKIADAAEATPDIDVEALIARGFEFFERFGWDWKTRAAPVRWLVRLALGDPPPWWPWVTTIQLDLDNKYHRKDIDTALADHDDPALREYLENGDTLLRLIANTPELAHLRALSLSSQHITVAGVAEITQNPHLRSLERLLLSHHHIDDQGLALIAQCPHLANLKVLTLLDNDIGDVGVEALASATFHHLKVLNLTDNRIGDVGASVLASALWLGGVKHLYLSDNRIGDDGLTELVSRSCLTALYSLGLYSNRIGDAGIEALSESFQLPALKDLYLDNNPISDDAVYVLGNVLERFELLTLNDSPVSSHAKRYMLSRAEETRVIVQISRKK